MTLTREEVERALIPAVKRDGLVSLTAGTVTGPRHVDGQIVDGPTGPVGQEGYVLNVDGHRMWLPFDGASPSHLAAIAALASRVAALESPGPWVACALGAGFTGAAWVRRLGPSTAEIAASVNGTFPQGDTSPLVVIPAAYLPTRPSGTGAPRLAAYLSGGYECIAWVAAVGLGVTQRTGAARTGVQVRGTYGL